MKKNFITGFLAGSLLFGAVGAFAVNYTATQNPYPVMLNGQNVQMEGYNINDNTYFKLRDISSVVGGFDVEFNNDTIQLSKDGYVYGIDYDKYIGTYEQIGGSLGFSWIFSIENISNNYITFTYTYEKPGSDFIVANAQFINPTTAISNYGDEKYTITLEDDRIIVDVNSEFVDRHHVFNLN